MLKLIKIILILVLISVLIAVIFRHALCQLLITHAVDYATGLKLSIDELSFDILNSSLYMRGATLFNPPGFKNKVLAKAKEIFIKYDLFAFLAGRVHLHKLKLNIGEINIIKNESGNSNAAAFKKFRKKADRKKSARDTLSDSITLKDAIVAAKKDKKELQSQPIFLIDNLELFVDELTYINHQAEIGETAVTVFTGQGPLIYTNVSSLNEVLSAVSARTFKQKLKDYLPKIE